MGKNLKRAYKIAKTAARVGGKILNGVGTAVDTGTKIAKIAAVLGSFKHGGKVQKTGLYKLHKGEFVIPLKGQGKKSKKSC